MKRLIGTSAFAMLGLAVGLWLSVQMARAEMEVLESSVPDIAVGSKLEDDAQLNLPDGTYLRLLLLTTGSTKTLNGPYEGTVADYKEEDRGWWQRIFGGDKKDNSTIGATRGLRAPSQ